MRRALLLVVLVGCNDVHDSDIDRPSDDCVERADNTFRTRFEGGGLVVFDGRMVQAVTSMRLADGSSITCRAATRTTIADGAFVARVTNRTDDAAYPRLGAFIDDDDDGACSAAVDPVWTLVSSLGPPDVEDVVTLTAESFALRADDEGCALLQL